MNEIPMDALHPFAQMKLEPGEKFPGKMTADKAVYSTIGLACMGLGGIVVIAGMILVTAPVRYATSPWLLVPLGCVLDLLGTGMCYAGYWIYCRGQRRH